VEADGRLRDPADLGFRIADLDHQLPDRDLHAPADPVQ
jgi:hypothetical protein